MDINLQIMFCLLFCKMVSIIQLLLWISLLPTITYFFILHPTPVPEYLESR